MPALPPDVLYVRGSTGMAAVDLLVPGVNWRFVPLDAPPATLHAACRSEAPPVAAVIEGTGETALATARDIHARAPLAQIIFLAAGPDGTAPYQPRPFVLRGVPWTLLRPDDPLLARRLAEQISIGERRHRHRTTIRAVNARLKTANTLDRRKLSSLASSERFLASFVQHSPDAIMTLSPAGAILGWNHAAARIWQLPPSAALDRPLEDLVAGPSRAALRDCLDHARRSGEPRREEFAAVTGSGALIPIETTIAPVTDESGEVIACLGIARDITERRLAQQELEDARDRAVAASQAKDDFLASLSHELRTPLTPVLLVASEAMGNPRLPPEVRADFSLIRKNVEFEARLIDDLLDLTRINRGQLVFRRQRTDAHAILGEAIRNLRPELGEKNIELTVELAAQRSIIEADPVRMQQVFWNVLRNAGKFTAAGGQVRVETENNELSSSLLVTVRDNGIGMTESELRHAFDMFAQGEHAHRGAHQYGGLGLGLAITRRLVELHGGTIRASSAGRGLGSAFTIEIPLVPVSGDLPDPAPRPARPSAAPRPSSTGNGATRL